jgi:hypothetical protein
MSFLQLITTVVTPATSYDLVTLPIVKQELGINDTSSDKQLKRYISGASAAAAQYCNRVFPVETVLDEFWPPRDFRSRLSTGIEPLQLSRFPIVANSVSAVIENAVTLVDRTDFRIDYTHGQLTRLNTETIPFPRHWPALAISAQYSAGFSPIPDDITDAVIRMIRNRFFARDRDPTLMNENIPGVYEARWWIATGKDAGNMTPDVTDLLDNYRVPVTA